MVGLRDPRNSSDSGTFPPGPSCPGGFLGGQTQDLAARVELLFASLPKQGRWEAEYLIRDLLADRALLAQTEGAVHPLIAEERTAVLRALRGERLSSQEYLTAERLLVQGYASSERLELQRYLTAERRAALEEVDRLGRAWIDVGFDRASALADRLFLRLITLLGILFAAALVLAVLFRARTRRTRRIFATPGSPRAHARLKRAVLLTH